MTGNHTARSGQDLITGLIEQLGAEQTRDRAARELVPAVHAAVYPMCLRMLGNRDDAYDVEHDTVLRLLNRVNSPNTAHEPIIQGKAYVRQIARNLCLDRLRDTGRMVPLDDLSEGDLPVAVDANPGSAVTSLAVARTLTDKALPVRYDKALSAAFGYTSKQLLGDFAGLSDLGLKVVMLRQLGLPDKEIAQRLGAGLTTGAVQQQGLRAMNHLRGIVHVQVWRQQPLVDWDEPPCPTLAPLKAEVKKALAADQKINDGLYQKIGKHLNPDPNRTAGSDRVPVCAICEPEREDSRHRYWWMLIFLAVFPLAESRPKLVLTAQHTDTPPPDDPASRAPALDRLEATGASSTTHRRYPRITVGALLGLLLLLAGIGISAGVSRGQVLSAPLSDLQPAASSPPTDSPRQALSG